MNEISHIYGYRSSKKKSDPVANSTKLKGVSNEQESREKQNLESSKATNAEIGRTKGRTEKRQRVTRSMHQESEKDCDDKEEPETKAGGEELKSTTNKSNAISETDGQEHKVAKEPAAKADGVERESAKEPNEEPNTEVQGRGSAKEIPACTTLIEEEDMSEESHRSVPETGKVENEDDQRVVKEETDKAEVGTIRVSVCSVNKNMVR